mgnify:CR=1 FL=1
MQLKQLYILLYLPENLEYPCFVHELFLEVMQNSPSRLAPDYGWEVLSLTVDPTTEDHPVTVVLKDSSGLNWGATKTVRANYVVGCDGARSLVRRFMPSTRTAIMSLAT